MQQGSEPSLDEILASIKQVIERDREQAAARQQAERDGLPREGVDPALEEEAADILDLGEAGVLIREDGTREDHADAPPVEPPAPPAPLASSGAAASVRQSLAALEALARPAETPRLLASGELSVDELARAMLRPMLAQWLDAHLPPLVERLVQAEIARIVEQRG